MTTTSEIDGLLEDSGCGAEVIYSRCDQVYDFGDKKTWQYETGEV